MHPLQPLLDHLARISGAEHGTQSELARRLGVRPDVVSRALQSSPRLATLESWFAAWEESGGPPVRVDRRHGELVVSLDTPAIDPATGRTVRAANGWELSDDLCSWWLHSPVSWAAHVTSTRGMYGWMTLQGDRGAEATLSGAKVAALDALERDGWTVIR